MNAIELVEQKLKEIGRDGLFNREGNCACLISDLAPCEMLNSDCEVGYKVPCDCQPPNCKFHVRAEK